VKVLITGGAGFLGRRLAGKLLERGTLKGTDGRDHAIDEIVLLDIAPAEGFSDARVRTIVGDISDAALLRRAVDRDTASVFHLAAIVSGQAEADFDLGMRINVDASRSLLEACRACGHTPRVVFTSSVAVYGGDLPATVPDSTALNPQSSYGMQKAIGELLVNDYSRKGFIDGRVMRLPTISVRPGKPNKAASSFASGIIREPLNRWRGVDVPVARDARVAPVTAPGDRRSHPRARSAGGGARDEPRRQPPGRMRDRSEMVAALNAWRARKRRSACAGCATRRRIASFELAGRLGHAARRRAFAGDAVSQHHPRLHRGRSAVGVITGVMVCACQCRAPPGEILDLLAYPTCRIAQGWQGPARRHVHQLPHVRLSGSGRLG
jgi:NAD(P)-dependent dehydrogenase (short-subunit alcohol dehydrogenase family)